MMRKQRWWLAVVCGFALVGVVAAQTAKKQAEQLRELFVDLDANHDGAIAKEEVPASGKEAFEQLLRRGDDNHNGKLEADEYRSLLQEIQKFNELAKKKAVERYRSMDKDGDGRISREEFTGPKPRFDLLDRNGDGLLTEQEFLAGPPAKAAGKAQAKKKADVKKSA
jgi:Ca2+-binding EF-hand superfamily protein